MATPTISTSRTLTRTPTPAAPPNLSIPSVAWTASGDAARAIARETRGARRPAVILNAAHALCESLAAVGIGITPRRSVRRRTTVKLTERELEVLRGISTGCPNAEIAHELGLSEETIKTHARRMYRKLGARDRANAVAIGIRDGYINCPNPA